MMSLEIFQDEFRANFLENTFPKMYNRYYDNKNPLPFDTQKIEGNLENTVLDELFSEHTIDMVYTSMALQNDIETIQQISCRTLKIKTFDYDGVKYKQKNANALIRKLQVELKALNEKIKQNDISIFQAFKALERQTETGPVLENLYNKFFAYDEEFESKYKIYDKLSNDLNFINVTTTYELIKANLFGVQKTEKAFKKEILILLEDPKFQSEITKEVKDNFDLYLSKEWKYFGNETYFDSNLAILFKTLHDYAYLLSRGHFLLKRDMLNYQEGLMKTM